MANVDKDIAAMLGSLRKYDKLTESIISASTKKICRDKEDIAADEDLSEEDAAMDGAGGEPEQVDESTADPVVLQWMARFARLGKMAGYTNLNEATGDDKFDSMLGKIGQQADIAQFRDNFKQDTRDEEFYKKYYADDDSSGTKGREQELIEAGDKIIEFIQSYVDTKFGSDSPDEGDGYGTYPPALFYTLRMGTTLPEFEQYLDDWEVDRNQVPVDVEKYALTDLVGWVCSNAGVSRDLFNEIEDLCYACTDGSSSDVLRMFPYNWYSGMYYEVTVAAWDEAREKLTDSSY